MHKRAVAFFGRNNLRAEELENLSLDHLPFPRKVSRCIALDRENIKRNAVAEIHIDLLLFHLRGAAVADVRKRVRIAEALFRVLELVDFTLLLRIPDFQELLVIFPRHEKVEIIVPRNKAAVADCTDTAAAAEITGQMVSLAPVVKHDGHFQIFFLQPAQNFVLGIKHLFSPLPLRSG